MMVERACMGKKIDIVTSEKIGMKAMVPGNGKTYEITWRDFRTGQSAHVHYRKDVYLRVPAGKREGNDPGRSRPV
jgi:hypothetical protein